MTPVTHRCTLSDPVAGTWTLMSGEVVADGIRVGRDPWPVALALSREVQSTIRLDDASDALIECYDPSGTDMIGQQSEGGALVCALRIRDGVVTPMVPK